MLTRIAPTPSGLLHAGNLDNFRRTAALADELGLLLALRIDDVDAARYRREFVDDIFARLSELDIAWTVGPKDTDDFERGWSQRDRRDYYRAELESLRSGTDTYACACSRRDLAGIVADGCPAECWRRRLDLVEGSTALRVRVPRGTQVDVCGTPVRLDLAIGDFVVWRRDGVPAYQLVSVVDDRDLGTTHIVRGEDLLASSAAQIHIATALGAANVRDAVFVHHPLVTDAEGNKLSKSRPR